MNNICQLKNVSKSYLDGENKKLTILSNVNFAIPQASQILITGKSGSGKSTLLYLLGGLDKAEQGEIYFNNQNSTNFTQKQFCEWRSNFVGIIFQFHYLLPDFTAYENIYLAGLITKQENSKLKKKVAELLELVGLSDRAKHRPSQLSGGEQQRIAIARSLINSPKIILADEPTGNLDLKTGLDIFTLLQKVCTENKSTLVMVTHNQELIQKFKINYTITKGKLVIQK